MTPPVASPRMTGSVPVPGSSNCSRARNARDKAERLLDETASRSWPAPMPEIRLPAPLRQITDHAECLRRQADAVHIVGRILSLA